MEYIDEAYKVNDRVGIEQGLGVEGKQVANILNRLFSSMIFKYGWVHCDPHPGNILVRKPPGGRRGVQLVLLDHGIYQKLTNEERETFCELWTSLVSLDNRRVKELAYELDINEYYVHLPLVLTFRRPGQHIALG